MIRYLEQMDLAGKRVFMRVDFNVPLDAKGAITDDTRIRAALPSIKAVLEKKGKLILGSHLGRPKGVDPKASMEPAAKRLAELLKKDVILADDCIGDGVKKNVQDLKDGTILMLENLRFHKEEEANDEGFARELAAIADVWINEAFGTAHRAHASTAGMARFVSQRGAGFLMKKEIEYLGTTRTGGVDDRIAQLMCSQIGRLEVENLGKNFDGWPLERIRRLRQHLSRRLLEDNASESVRARAKSDLDILLFCENINAHSHDYLLEQPGLERLCETVERLDEMMNDQLEVPVVPMGVTVSVGPAIDVRSFAEQRKGERGGDPLVQHLRTAIQERVDHLRAQGPPAEWGCPCMDDRLVSQVPSLSLPTIPTAGGGLRVEVLAQERD